MAQTKKLNKVVVGGNVKISAYKGKRKIKLINAKNNATYHLFNFLLLCLAGNLKQNNRPVFLKVSAVNDIIGFKDAVPSIFATTKLNSVSVSRYTVDGLGNIESQGNVTNQFFMLYSAFATSDDVTSIYPKVFTLQDNSNNTLAEVTLDEKSTIEINPTVMNYSLLIDWSISFQNPNPVVEEPEATL